MKKLIAFLLTLMLSVAMAACGTDNPNVDSPAAGDETPAVGETAVAP
jgi:predicted small lipoprotein YifL